jgi:hypothetical protein
LLLRALLGTDDEVDGQENDGNRNSVSGALFAGNAEEEVTGDCGDAQDGCSGCAGPAGVDEESNPAVQDGESCHGDDVAEVTHEVTGKLANDFLLANGCASRLSLHDIWPHRKLGESQRVRGPVNRHAEV